MGSIIRNLKSFSGGLLTLAIMLIALFFVLNFAAKRGWGPVSTAAQWTATHASGDAYAAPPAPIVGIPSTTLGPNI